MNDFTNWSPTLVWLAAGVWGLACGALSFALVAGPVRRMAAAGADRERITTLQQQVLLRYLLRMALSFVSLLMVFLVIGRPAAILAALAGIILAGDVPLFFLMRARRERA